MSPRAGTVDFAQDDSVDTLFQKGQFVLQGTKFPVFVYILLP